MRKFCSLRFEKNGKKKENIIFISHRFDKHFHFVCEYAALAFINGNYQKAKIFI